MRWRGIALWAGARLVQIVWILVCLPLRIVLGTDFGLSRPLAKAPFLLNDLLGIPVLDERERRLRRKVGMPA